MKWFKFKSTEAALEDWQGQRLLSVLPFQESLHQHGLTEDADLMLSHCVLLPTPEAAADYEQFLRSLSATDIAQEAYLEGDANQLIVSFQTVTKVAVKILVEHIFKLESYALKMAGSYDGFDLIAAKPA